jgi:hypothetical protein
LCIPAHSWSFALRWPGRCTTGCDTYHPLATAADASIAGKVVVPYCGPTTVVSTTGYAYCALQPISAQSASVQASQPLPLPPPTASIAGQVIDPHCGQTKVVLTTGGAHCAPQPEPGLVIHNGQVSAPRVTMPMPPLVAAAAARNPGLVSSHFVDMGSGIVTRGVTHEPQPAASQAAVRNLERELKSAAPSGPRQSAATPATHRRTDYSPPWSAGASSSVRLHSAFQPAAMPAVMQPPGCGQLTVQVLLARDRAFLDRITRHSGAWKCFFRSIGTMSASIKL